ncbi:MAG: hypothetical protein KJ638_06435, partial [Chloroflexi bacterium]|nr:hypothetical protein [Chloroflexota bacterium]
YISWRVGRSDLEIRRNYSGYNQMYKNRTRTLAPAASTGVTRIQRIYTDYFVFDLRKSAQSAFYSYDG